MSTPVIRAITEADWPQVHALVVEVATAGLTYAMEVPGSELETRETWTGAHTVVSVDGATVLGSARMGANRPAQGAHVGTASFMVSASAQSQGVGRALGDYAVQWHREKGFSAIQFNAVVSTNTTAVALWHSLGFATVGTVPRAFRLPDASRADLLVMWLDLSG